MYSKRPSIVVGFHGCDESVRDLIVNHQTIPIPSTNDYDWLGHGFYFWENNDARALQWAEDQSKNPNSSIKKPAILGAYIDLGNCLDLLDSFYLYRLKQAYPILCDSLAVAGKPMLKNKPIKSGDLIVRQLDCAVFEVFHNITNLKGEDEYDTVRGVFWEGEELYPGAGMQEKNHIQICVRNINHIKAFFIPRKKEIANPFFVKQSQLATP